MITSIEELPTEVRNSLSEQDQRIWMGSYNTYVNQGQPADKARMLAWIDCSFLESSRYVCANVSTEVVDREGDLAVVEEYVRAGQDLVRRGGPLTKNHSNKVIGVVWAVDENVDDETGKPCVRARMNYFRGTELYDTAWEEFKHGRTEYSIASFTQKPIRECGFNGCYFKLVPEMWFELSNVDRGINPRTYPFDYNEKAKGESFHGRIIEFHDDVECPVKKKYLAFKARMQEYGHDVSYNEHFLLIHRPMGEDELAYVYDEYPDIRQFEIMMGESDDDVYTLIAPKFTVNDSHIGTDEESSVVADSDINEATKGNCPAGQHEHPGVWGCHDILRRHQIDDKTTPTDVLDLTDENIDISAIKSTPTDTLKNIVTKIASILSRYSDDAVQQFLSSTQGKEFVLAFLELKKRKMNGEKNMAEKEAGCSAKAEIPEEEIKAEVPEVPVEVDKADMEPKEPVEEAEKGAIPDIQSSIANISSTLASITALIDQMNIRLMKLEDSDLMDGENGEPSITDAIMSETADVGAPEIPAPKEEESDEEKSEVPPQFEKTDDDVKSEDSDKEEVEVKVEEDSDKDESEDDSGEEGEDSEDEESKDDKSEEKDSEEKDSEEESEEESKDESEDEEEDKEKKKGTEDVAPATEPVADAPVEQVAESVDTEKSPAENAEVPEVAEVSEVASDIQPVADIELPVPPGGQVIDFRAMLLKRQTELREKGVELYIAGEGAQNSLATVPIQKIKGTNVTLIHPSESIKGFDVESGINKESMMSEILNSMGKMDSNSFIRKITGE